MPCFARGVPVCLAVHRSRTTWASCVVVRFPATGLLGGERHFQRHIVRPLRETATWTLGGVERTAGTLSVAWTKDAVAKDLPPKVEIVESYAG